jgi:hypothetical protein
MPSLGRLDSREAKYVGVSDKSVASSSEHKKEKPKAKPT